MSSSVVVAVIYERNLYGQRVGRFVQQTGFACRVSPNQDQLDRMIKKAFSSLMNDDYGESSRFEASDGLIIEELRACKHLKAQKKVFRIEGDAMFGGPRALPALVVVCRKQGRISLQLANYERLQLGCKTPLTLDSYFYATYIDEPVEALK